MGSEQEIAERVGVKPLLPARRALRPGPVQSEETAELPGEHHLGLIDHPPQGDQPVSDRVHRQPADVGQRGQPAPDELQPLGR